ncbi:MAG: hypothetical protein IPN84_17775 [Sphingomonadales bacterium]|nr:hypothetical protein [Sphingomonadales bacterium]
MKPTRLPIANLAWLITFWAIAHAAVIANLHFPNMPRLIGMAMIAGFAVSTFAFCVYVRTIDLSGTADKLLATISLIFNMAFLVGISDLGSKLRSEIKPVGILLIVFWAYGMKAVWDQLRDAFK